MNLKIDQLNIGVAMPQVLGSSVKYSENYGGEVFFNLIRHYIGTAQYDLPVQGNRMVLSPYVQIRAADNVPFQFDAGAMFAMKKYGFVGASWRNDYAVTTNIGYYLTPQLTLGYAHDFSLNTYASQLGTSNEFMLSWSFGENSKMERLENEIKKLKENDRRKMEQYEEMLEERLEEMGDEIEVEEAAKKAGKEAAKETLEQYLKDNPNIGQEALAKARHHLLQPKARLLLPTRYLRVQRLPVRVRRPHQRGVCQPTPNLERARILCRGRCVQR